VGDPVRPWRERREERARAVGRLRAPFAAVAVLVACSAAVTLHVACGFDVVASGPGTAVRSRDPSDGAAGVVEDATQQPVTCDAPRAMCGPVCTDLSADPASCGSCGNACAAGQTCDQGKCDVLCVGGTVRCHGACIDPTSDPSNCGACDLVCPADKKLCAASTCSKTCEKGQTRCDADAGAGGDAGAAYCATTETDRSNCGTCGHVCTTNQSCVAGACKDLCVGPARVGDVFSPSMVGCVDHRQWTDRAKTCPPGSTVCTAAQWNGRPGAKKPTFNYWTDDYLQWLGDGPGACVAVTNGSGYACNGFPMHVCGATTDPVGNTCTWTHCGYVAPSPDQFYGGCAGNYYAGALCCTPP
jgi:hypothetical protein